MNTKKLSIAIILLFSVSALTVIIPQTEATVTDNQWLTGWTYRKPLTVTNAAGADTNYQCSITLMYGSGTDTATKIYLPGVEADFRSVRFTSDNGVTLLSCWNQTYNYALNTTYWFKVTANLTAVNATVYVYWGNTAASPVSNQTATFVDVISGVVGAWNLEETAGGNAVDYSGNNNTGTATGTTVVDGKFPGKKSRYFTTNEYITALSSPIDIGNQSAYLTGWFKSNYIGSGRILTFESPSYTVWGGLNKNGAGEWRLTVYDGITDPITATFTDVTLLDDAWHFFVLEREYGVKLRIYIDNVLKADLIDTAGTVPSQGTHIYFGANLAEAYYYQGSYENFIFGKGSILSDVQRSSIFNNYPDVTLEASKVLVRKYVSTGTEPTISSGATQQNSYTVTLYKANTPVVGIGATISITVKNAGVTLTNYQINITRDTALLQQNFTASFLNDAYDAAIHVYNVSSIYDPATGLTTSPTVTPLTVTWFYPSSDNTTLYTVFFVLLISLNIALLMLSKGYLLSSLVAVVTIAIVAAAVSSASINSQILFSPYLQLLTLLTAIIGMIGNLRVNRKR